MTIAFALLTPAWAQEERITRDVEDPNVIIRSIFVKLEYDQSYFSRVLRAKASGRRPKDIPEEAFAREVRRATKLQPVVSKILEGRPRFEKDGYLEAPGRGQATIVYDNLVGLLNMIKAKQRTAPLVVTSYGERINLTKIRDLGLRRKGEPRYRLRLLREYFHLMGWASFRLGNDEDAKEWFDKLVQDPRLKELRDKSGQTQLTAEEARERRAQRLRLSTIAVNPLQKLNGPEDIDWLGPGMMEVLVSDLSRYTDLTIVERSQLDKLVEEYRFRYYRDDGETNELDKVKEILDAGTLFVGNYAPEGDAYRIQVRLVAVSDGLILGSAQGKASQDDAFRTARQLALEILTEIDWVEPFMATEMIESRAPKADVIRDLVMARSLMTTKSEEARKLYEKALQSDPNYSQSFGQLKEQFPDVKAKTVLAPFMNVSRQSSE
ncbi:MAG: hypothetical protein AAFV29_13170, partial [Myxococcota bacterium]